MRARQRQMIARGAAATLVLGVIAAIGVAGATAIRARTGSNVNGTPATGDALQPTDSATDPAMVLPSDSTPAEAPRLSVENAPVSGAVVAPVVPVGRTVLRDTMMADRAGDTVRVSFDLAMSRTRRAEKFEAIVRSTLPQVYGATADSALRALPFGSMARAGDLVTTLAEQGFHIPVPGGRTIAVWPETRAGRDGPLVVAYRAVASR
jgi:hypothetical protein